MWKEIVLSLKFRLWGRLFSHFEGRSPKYIAKCKIHGFYVDHPHGEDEILECPVCLKERVRRAKIAFALLRSPLNRRCFTES